MIPPAIAVGLGLLVLTGCASQAQQLVRNPQSPVVSGQFLRTSAGGSMVLEFDGRAYTGDFPIERSQNMRELRERYHSSSRQWDAIFSGLDATHLVNRAMARLLAPDGETLDCHLAWRSGADPAGSCTTKAGTSFIIQFE